jgi:hypothetical protein
MRTQTSREAGEGWLPWSLLNVGSWWPSDPAVCQRAPAVDPALVQADRTPGACLSLVHPTVHAGSEPGFTDQGFVDRS